MTPTPMGDPDPNDVVEGQAIPEGQRLPALSRADHDHECDDCGGTGRVTDPVLYEGNRVRDRLERGWRKRWLILELAKGEVSRRDIARCMNCYESTIRGFERRHLAEIAEAQNKLEDEFVGLWVASKVNRLAEYQQDIEDANTIIEAEFAGSSGPRETDPLDPGANDEQDANPTLAPLWVRLKESALRAVAEELGQIPNRVRLDIGGSVATYRIESEPGQPAVDLDQV